MYWNLTMHWVQLKSYRAFRVPCNNFCVNCFRPIIFLESSQQISQAKETCYLYNRLPPLISCRWGLRQYVFALYVRLCVRTFPPRNTLSFGHVNLNDDGLTTSQCWASYLGSQHDATRSCSLSSSASITDTLRRQLSSDICCPRPSCGKRQLSIDGTDRRLWSYYLMALYNVYYYYYYYLYPR